MTNISADDQTVSALVEENRVHGRVYTDPAIYELEMQRIFGKTWNFVGHESQIPEIGDFLTTTVVGQPVVLVRQPDRSVEILYNRCGHRGALVVGEKCGNAKNFNCIYHGWTFKTDGELTFVPLEDGYKCTSFDKCDPQYGMPRVAQVESYKGFVFARLVQGAQGLTDFLGGVADTLDHLVDMSPEGTISVHGGSFRTVYPCNWKIYLENMHDGVHPRFVHQSSVSASRQMAAGLAKANKKKLFAVEIVEANGQSYSALDDLEVRVFPNGHSDMRGFRKPVNDEPVFVRFADQLRERHGKEYAGQVLTRNFHNMCVYPGLSIHPGFLQLRVLTPLAVDRTMVEIWNLRLDGAPEEIHQRTITYANTVHSPSSIIKPDDLEAYRRVQVGLASKGTDWVSNHRREGNEKREGDALIDSSLSEHFIRNQYRAWSEYMKKGD